MNLIEKFISELEQTINKYYETKKFDEICKFFKDIPIKIHVYNKWNKIYFSICEYDNDGFTIKSLVINTVSNDDNPDGKIDNLKIDENKTNTLFDFSLQWFKTNLTDREKFVTQTLILNFFNPNQNITNLENSLLYSLTVSEETAFDVHLRSYAVKFRTSIIPDLNNFILCNLVIEYKDEKYLKYFCGHLNRKIKNDLFSNSNDKMIQEQLISKLSFSKDPEFRKLMEKQILYITHKVADHEKVQDINTFLQGFI